MEDIVPILGIMVPIMALLIPIVAILTAHQRKMAEIIHGNQARIGDIAEIQSLRSEVSALRDRVNEQIVAVDTLKRQLAGQNEPILPPEMPVRPPL